MRRSRSTRVNRAAAALAGVGALLLASPAGADDPVATLRSRNLDLAAQSRRALLDIYALDSQLDGARHELARLQRAAARVREERAAGAVRLAVAKESLARAQAELGALLRELYEQTEPDPLSVLFGATSLEELIAGFDGLRRAANATAGVVKQARDARREVLDLAAALAAEEARIEQLAAAASKRQAALEAARGERRAVVARLRSEYRLNADQIARLEARARVAEARAQLATVRARTDASVLSFAAQASLLDSTPSAAPASPAPARPPELAAPAPERPPAATVTEPSPPDPLAPRQPLAVLQLAPGPPQPAQPPPDRAVVVVSTGYALTGTTATGLPVGPGVVAVDPSVIPLGTRMTIPGYGEGVAADTGFAIKGDRIDLWFPSRELALAWGWRTLTVVLH